MCDCIKEINARLKEAGKNTQLAIPITWKPDGKLVASRVAIATRKLDDNKREKPIVVLPAYCPFCGVAYEPPKQ